MGYLSDPGHDLKLPNLRHMSTITSLKLGSVPITEEGVERYRFADPVENHFTQIYQSNDEMNCSVGRVFSKMKVPVSWIEVMNANYLIAEIEFNNPPGSSMNIRAWIDSIDLVSDSDDRPMVEIKWHFDYYEMYKSLVVLGYGHVKRRPFGSLSSTPIQNYSYRYLALPDNHLSSAISLITFKENPVEEKDTWYVLVSANVKKIVLGNTYTDVVYYTFPLVKNSPSYNVYCDDQNGGGFNAPSFEEIMNGRLEELLGLDPNAINGVWLSPIDPIYGYYSGNKYVGVGGTFTPGYGSWGSYEWAGYTQSQTVGSLSLTSDEKDHFMIAGFDGSKIIDLPYGMTITSVTSTLIMEATSSYLEIWMKDKIYGRLEGCTTTIPLPLLPINENAFSSYVYSGQRDYDVEMRTVQSNSNAWKTSAGGGGQGAMMGAFGPAGAAAGVIGGVSGGLISYGVEMLYQNDEEQRLLDRLKASQTPGMLMADIVRVVYRESPGIVITKTVPDSYSQDQMINTRNNFGISVDEIRSSCDALVRTDLPVGYYSIKNLIISGAAPKEAKDYIKKKFDAGVKLL